jgi:EAL domain-containing protein (putative c-di-GMP-specific phosphodiesterase class I)
VRGILAATGLPPEALTLEVTESVLAERAEEVLELLRGVRRLGVGLVLDDVGTGVSSLSSLTRLPVDALKVDRSFVEQLGRPAEGAAEHTEVVRAVVQLGRALRLRTVAEGVATAEQRAVLVDLGCDLAQGPLFAAPMTAAELTAVLGAATPGAPGATPAIQGAVLGR